MVWQLLVTIVLVITSISYLAYSFGKSLRGKSSGCGGGCDCGKKNISKPATMPQNQTLIPLESLILRKSRRDSTVN